MGENRKMIKAILLAASSLMALAAAALAPSVHLYVDEFSDVHNIEFLSRMIVTTPALTIGLASPFAGFIIDRFGRVRLLVFSLALFAASGSAGLWLSDIYLLILSRAVLGLAIAGTMTVSITLIADYFAGRERTALLGYQGAVTSVGGVVILSAGGVLADISWRAPFAVYLLTAPLLPLCLRYLYEPEKRIVSQPVKSPDNDNDRIESKWIIFACISAFLCMVFLYMIPTQFPFFIKTIAKISNTKLGITMSMMGIAGGVVSCFFSRLISRFTHLSITVIGFTSMGIGCLILSFADRYSQTVIALLMMGAGFGFLVPNAIMWTVSLAPEHLRGRLTSAVTSSLFLGQFLSPILLHPIIARSTIRHSFTVSGYFLLTASVIVTIIAISEHRRILGRQAV